ncbi:MAG: 50S ribosomal protein L13 [archaeon]
MKTIVLDGKDAIVGRLGSLAAKNLLKGNNVIIINSEEAVISGSRKDIVDKIHIRRSRGGASRKGPRIPMLSDRLLKRMIRGMLPWDRTRGQQAYKRLRCYVGSGAGKVEEKDMKNIITMENKIPPKFTRIKEIIKEFKAS